MGEYSTLHSSFRNSLIDFERKATNQGFPSRIELALRGNEWRLLIGWFLADVFSQGFNNHVNSLAEIAKVHTFILDTKLRIGRKNINFFEEYSPMCNVSKMSWSCLTLPSITIVTRTNPRFFPSSNVIKSFVNLASNSLKSL